MARALAIALLALTLLMVSSWPSQTAPDTHEPPVNLATTTARR